MRFRVPPWRPLIPIHHFRLHRPIHHCQLRLTRALHATRSSFNGDGGGSSKGNSFVVPGATMATIVMLGILHARRLYDDKKVEAMKEKGIEPEFSPDAKAAFLKLLPLRSISHFCGFMASLELPVWLRPFIYKAWARAFHSNLEEAALPLEHYPSLQDFFVRSLKEGSRPIDQDPNCLVSPVDGIVLRLGKLKGSRGMIEQVKGFSYSASSLLGTNFSLDEAFSENVHHEDYEHSTTEGLGKKSWWRISFASPKVRVSLSDRPMKDVFYCVLYLRPGDYHRVHSPVDWHVFLRRHIPGHLFPVNERATRTIKNLHVENERVVLEGQWGKGFMAITAIGATNIGSIKLFIEPEFMSNKPRWRLLYPDLPNERPYGPQGVGVTLNKGEEIAAFNMGSTVVLIFHAPTAVSMGKGGLSSEFKFCVEHGDRVKVGEAIGRWGSS